MGLLFDAVQHGHVLRSRFVSSGRRSDVSSVSSVGEPSGIRSSGYPYAVAQVSGGYRFVVVRFDFVALRTADFQRSGPAGTRSEIGIVSGSAVASPEEFSPKVHRVGSSAHRRIGVSVSQIPTRRTGSSVKRHDRARRNAGRNRAYPGVQIVEIRGHLVPERRTDRSAAGYASKRSERRARDSRESDDGKEARSVQNPVEEVFGSF